MIKNFIVYNTTVKHGQMNSAAKFYPDITDAKERKALMRQHKQKIADEIGFLDINKIFMTCVKANCYEYGTTYTVTSEDVQAYFDLYDLDALADAAKITSDTPEVAIGFNFSDGANIIAMNPKTLEATSTWCEGRLIDKGVPSMIAKNLGGNPEDILIDVSPFAYTIPFDISGELRKPNYVNDMDVWKDCLEPNGKFLLVDQKKAILRQLEASGIPCENIYLRENSLFNPAYYSSQRARLYSDPTQDGRCMHAVMFQDGANECEYTQSYIKKYPVTR